MADEEIVRNSNDAVILNYSQNHVEYQSVPKVWLTHPDSTEDDVKLVPFTYGEAVSKSVEVDFSGGDMAVEIPEGELVTELTVKKPEELVPENIAEGKYIGGVGPGTHQGSGGVEVDYLAELAMGGSRLVSPDTQFVVSSIFQGNSYIQYVSFPACSQVGSNAFASCSKLESVILPECTSIGSSAFQNCANLQLISAPSCKNIGSFAFASCSKLENTGITELLSVPTCAFSGCYQLKAANFSGVTSIGYCGFYKCSSLEEIDYPECLYVNDYAFQGCTNLRSVNLSGLAASIIGSYAFANCSVLSYVCLGGSSKVNIYSGTFNGACAGGSLLILGNMTLYSFAFRDISARKVTFGSVTWTAYPSVFAGCSTLVDVDIHGMVWTSWFMDCSNLVRVSCRNRIGSYAFLNCTNLQVVKLSNVSYFSTLAFAHCSKLSVIYIENFRSLNTSYTTIAPFQYTPIANSSYLGYYGSIYVPASLVDTFKGAAIYSGYADRITEVTPEILALFEGEVE